jgi:hypothetical chaperone protein
LRLIDELLYGGQAWAFYRAIEQAKVELSSSEKTFVDFRRPWADVHVPVTRGDFERLIAPDLARVRGCIEDALDAAGVNADEVEFVTRTGGSSQIPAFERLLRDLFDEAEIVQRDPFTCVVTGLAEYAAEEWGT